MAKITLGPEDVLDGFVHFIQGQPFLKSSYPIVTFSMLKKSAQKLVRQFEPYGLLIYKDDRIEVTIIAPK